MVVAEAWVAKLMEEKKCCVLKTRFTSIKKKIHKNEPASAGKTATASAATASATATAAAQMREKATHLFICFGCCPLQFRPWPGR